MLRSLFYYLAIFFSMSLSISTNQCLIKLKQEKLRLEKTDKNPVFLSHFCFDISVYPIMLLVNSGHCVS